MAPSILCLRVACLLTFIYVSRANIANVHSRQARLADGGEQDLGIGGLYGGWSEWGPCSKSCGGGIKRRICISTTSEDIRYIGADNNCKGDNLAECNTDVACGLDGGWTEWGPCSRTCEGGIKRRRCSSTITSEDTGVELEINCIGNSLSECNTDVQCGASGSSTLSDLKEAMEKIDFDEVKKDIVHLLTNSLDFWPADFGNYGPLLIRLAWHSSGSYRSSDGRGGSDGARMRFEPERSWDDNTNLDKARALLWPIKQKYGKGLSWGDLIILAGNTAISSMGGLVLGFCGGRVDDHDGLESNMLGPSEEQERMIPCEEKGNCKDERLGTTTLGLIYVNPQGPMGNPVPKGSAEEIRFKFGRMGMNDSETVALIGGGHSFGKAHGACPNGAGKAPKDDPTNSWPGKCGSGKGKDTFTSGIELSWTTNPTHWDNEFFKNLLNFEWAKMKGPGDSHQWEIKGSEPIPKIGMMTTDIALLHDDEYKAHVIEWAENQASFDHAFSHVWYKLTTRDMGPITRCIGNDIPPPQPFQNPLPPTPKDLADFSQVKQKIEKINISNLGLFIRLSWQCSSTFRATDYLGGCNGARIRFAPENDWEVNVNLDKALYLLNPIKRQFGASLSWADLIILSGDVAVERTSSHLSSQRISIPFCGGRTDAEDGSGSIFLAPKIAGNFSETIAQFFNYRDLMGLTSHELAVLNGAGYSIGDSEDCMGLFCQRNVLAGIEDDGESGMGQLSNIFFTTLLSEQWEETVASSGRQMYKAVGTDMFMLKTDLMFRHDPTLRAISEDYAADNELFLSDFVASWSRLNNIDRFDGPFSNLCDN